MGGAKRGRVAWLVTWEWAGEHARVPDSEVVVGVFNPRLGPESVKRLVEILYAAREYDATDKLGALTHNPYPAQFTTIRITVDGVPQNIPWAGEVICGHNPYLRARLVNGLRRSEPGSDVVGLVWDERPRPTAIG